MNKLKLKFSRNWNGKLCCDSFTTIRLYNPQKYVFGRVFEVYLKNEYLGEVQMIGSRKTLLSKINSFVARIDTGYTQPQAISLLRRMYGHDKDHVLGLYLFTWTKRAKTSSVNVRKLNERIAEMTNPQSKINFV